MPNKIPLNIVIDTNLLREDLNLTKSDLSYLKELAKLKLVKLHFPWFIYKECTSNNVSLITKEINDSINNLKRLDKKGLHTDEFAISEKIINDLAALKGQVEKSVEKLWADFIKESDSILYSFDPNDSKVVFEDYFSGNPPFSSLKNRNDIPDAFIFNTLKKIAATKKIHLICKDGNLRKKSGEDENITTHLSFEEFFQSDSFKTVKDKHEELKKFEELKSILLERRKEIEKDLQQYFYNRFERLDFEDRYLPSDNCEGTIAGIENIVSMELLDDEIKFIDDNFYFPVIIKAECFIEYNVFKSDYFMLNEERQVNISELNDHYYEAEERLPITFEFNVIVPKTTLEDDLDFELEINEFDKMFIDQTDSVEIYSLDREKVKLEANKMEKVSFPKTMSLENRVFKIEYRKFNRAAEIKRIKFEVYNLQGHKISKTIILESSGVMEFKMLYDDFMENNQEFSFVDLTANCNISIEMSIYKNEYYPPNKSDLY